MFTIGCPQQVCASRELDIDAEPSQQCDDRLARVGEQRVVEAGHLQGYAHTISPDRFSAASQSPETSAGS